MSYTDAPGKTMAERVLYCIMSDISESCWCAGWECGNEAACWEAVLRGGTPYGQGEITAQQAEDLQLASQLAGGWWHWPNDSREPQFVSLDEWRRVYAEVWKRD